MYKVIIPSVLAYILIGVMVFCLIMKRALYVAMCHRDWREMKDPLNMLDVNDYCFAAMAGVVWPMFLMVVAMIRAGDWMWDTILSKIVLNYVKKELENEKKLIKQKKVGSNEC